MTGVEVVSWPEGADDRNRLQRLGLPCLLIVAPSGDIPSTESAIEDWVWRTASPAEVKARTASLVLASQQFVSMPWLDDAGILNYRGARVALPPVESRLIERLLADFGTVVARDELSQAAWGSTPPGRNALDVHVLRIRRRIEKLGLGIRTVRGRGYLLDAV